MARRPDPPPLATNDARAVAVGLALWLVALAVLVPMHASLSRHHEIWWIWTCVVGLVLGGYGLWFVVWLQRRRRSPG
ncbi:MAG TPA: DUF2530 domain-containing protein [Mycobacteriales bacterium]|nr:DUF2530 domain-containing protein [Mycobacteriales bacterium]